MNVAAGVDAGVATGVGAGVKTSAAAAAGSGCFVLWSKAAAPMTPITAAQSIVRNRGYFRLGGVGTAFAVPA